MQRIGTIHLSAHGTFDMGLGAIPLAARGALFVLGWIAVVLAAHRAFIVVDRAVPLAAIGAFLMLGGTIDFAAHLTFHGGGYHWLVCLGLRLFLHILF